MSNAIIHTYKIVFKGVDQLQFVFALVLRVWLAQVFFMSGLTKIKSWDTTLMLFEYEYAVPLISFELAAYMATAAELIIPVLLIAGLLTRPAALALFILNIVAMTSYPDISPAGVNEHKMWAFMIATLFFYGAGKVSVDYWVSKKCESKCKDRDC
jgi:putative oxidoreductase